MYAMTGIIKGNTVLTNDNSVEKYNGRKVIITVLDDEKSEYGCLSGTCKMIFWIRAGCKNL